MASASCWLLSLHSAVKVRRFAFATPSGSGREANAASAPALAAAPLRYGSLRSPSAPFRPSPTPKGKNTKRNPGHLYFLLL
jgi:hypothetical protein